MQETVKKEYIEREAARDLLEAAWMDDWNLSYSNDRLDEIPAADVVEVIHAHWVKPTKIGGRSVDVPHCSHCKEIPCGVDMNTHYCPYCGAKMDGGADDGRNP